MKRGLSQRQVSMMGMKSPSCDGCHHRHTIDVQQPAGSPEPSGKIHQCRRMPPVITMRGSVQVSDFPRIDLKWRCGEWRARTGRREVDEVVKVEAKGN